jgi:hypothetical protein
MKHIPLDFCYQYLKVDPTSHTGLRWILSPARSVKVGSVAGSLHRTGYYQIQIQGKHYKTHRIVYAMIHNMDPVDYEIDHIDLNKSNNNIDNLRIVTHRQNSQNRPDQSSLGVGVTKVGSKYRAQIQITGNKSHIGLYDTPKDALIVYNEACQNIQV